MSPKPKSPQTTADTSTDWFPPDVDPDSGSGKYLNIKKVPLDKECRIRILSPAISGTLRWGKLPDAPRDAKNRPFRKRKAQTFPEGIVWDAESTEQEFIAFAVWTYDAGKVQILELTQRTIQSQLRDFAKDGDWGNPRDYDIGITRKDNGGKISYIVKPKPKRPLGEGAADIWTQLLADGFDLDRLYDGGDPFPGNNTQHAEVVEDDDLPF